MMELRDKLITPRQALKLKDAGVDMESFNWAKTTRKHVEEDGDDLGEFLIRSGRCYGTTMTKDSIILNLYDYAELCEIANADHEAGRCEMVDNILDSNK